MSSTNKKKNANSNRATASARTPKAKRTRAPADALPTPQSIDFVWRPGLEPVFIRTVTHYYVGQITFIDNDFIGLDRASWVADTGRFASFLATGEAFEVEPFGGPCVVSRGAIVDISPWRHALLETVK